MQPFAQGWPLSSQPLTVRTARMVACWRTNFTSGSDVAFPFSAGIFAITDIGNRKSGIIALNGSAHTVSIMADPDAGFWNASGHAGTVNIYWGGGSDYRLQNSTGATIDLLASVANADWV